MDTNELPTQAEESIPSRDEVKSLEKSESGNQSILPILIGIVVLILVGLSVGIFFLAKPDTDTARIRDIFIIFMALESLLIGIALVILLVQMARLINLLQNEIKPMLDSTQETIGHLRGTTVFLSNNLVEPVVKLNEYMAGFSQLLSMIGISRKGKKVNTPKGE